MRGVKGERKGERGSELQGREGKGRGGGVQGSEGQGKDGKGGARMRGVGGGKGLAKFFI